MNEVGLDYHIGKSNSPEGKDILDSLGDTNYRPKFTARHRLTQRVVGMLVDEVCEVLKQVTPGQANIALRTILSDVVAQTAHALDQARSVGDLRHIAVKLNEVLQFAYKCAGIQPTVPSKTLIALFRVAKLMVKRHNAEC